MKLLPRLLALLSLLLIATLSCQGAGNTISNADAVIIDQLYDFQSNEAFTDEARAMLEDYGFGVDIVRGEAVTLDYYRRLPESDYKLIIFRAHSGLLGLPGGSPKQNTSATYLFTGEPYTVTGDVWEQLGDRISPGQITADSSPVFAVNSEFIRQSMNGRFRDTVVIMMGCSTAYQSDMAEAFVDKGASAYIGWSASVTLDYVDRATISLLDNLLVKNLALQDAVAAAMSEVGLDPDYNAHAKYYPANAGQKSIRELLSSFSQKTQYPITKQDVHPSPS